jgi:hypothetical protein
MLLFAALLLLLATFAAAMAPRRPLPPPPPSALPDDAGLASTIERRIPAGEGASTAVRVKRGEILRLEVAGDMLDSVSLDGLDRIEVIEPVTPAIFDLLAERPGTYPIRLVEANRRIGRLVITP